MTNLVAGYALLFGVGEFAFRLSIDALVVALGVLGTGVGVAVYLGNVRQR